MDILKVAKSIAESNSEVKLNQYIASLSTNSLDAQMNVCNEVFRKFDAISNNHAYTPQVLSTLLIMPVELSKFHQLKESSLSQAECEKLIELISSHFLARSNSANDSLRLSTILFFTQVMHQETWKLQRILERFGENLLQSIFKIYITDKQRASIALNFLLEHMEIFFSTSAELAGMTNSFFQNYMFKHHASFVGFMNEYKTHLLEKKKFAPFFVVHLGFLMRQALDLDHEILSFHLLKILIQYVSEFEPEIQNQNFEIITKIMLHCKTLKGREIGLYIQKEFKSKRKISFKHLAKQFSMDFPAAGMPISSGKKMKKSAENMSLFKKIILLCVE